MQSQAALANWIKALPVSKINYPTRLQRHFFIWYTGRHESIRNALINLGVLKHTGRQVYLLGKIAKGVSIKQFVSYLIDKGYGNHFIAWKDDGEIASLRYTENFKYQYHIRVFEDGEVRGHYEYTPEYRPISHSRKIGQEACREKFLSLLGDMIVPSTQTN